MIKRAISFFLVLVLTFSFFVCGSGDPNTGSISGLRGSEYTAYFHRLGLPRTEAPIVTLISDSQELAAWRETVQQEFADFRPGPNALDWWNNFFEENIGNYDDIFFKIHQLVFVSNLRASSSTFYEVRRIRYQNGILYIRLRHFILGASGCWGRNSILLDSVPCIAIIELTRISPDLNIELSIRDDVF